jgi:hypothetical protein
MPRAKAKEPVKMETESVPVTIEVSPELYAQIKSAATMCGYTPEEWVLLEAVMGTI